MQEPAARSATLTDALHLVQDASDVESAVVGLRDRLAVEHLSYNTSKLGWNPSVRPYVRTTYPASWVKRYLQMNYVDIDPVMRQGFLRLVPFSWSELSVASPAEGAMMADALAHGVGPHGLSIPLRSRPGHRGLFSVSSSEPGPGWDPFRVLQLPDLVEVANSLHQRVIREEFGEEQPHLTARELDCLFWTSEGKEASDIAGILQISPHTIRDYLKSARFKLDCVTSTQAVSKAVRLGLLVIK